MTPILLDRSRSTTILSAMLGFAALADAQQQWHSVSPPAARANHALVFDTARNRAVMFGGQSVANPGLDDTWEFDGTAWHGVPVLTAPPGRSDHAMAFDLLRNRVVMFGGRSAANANLDDTWEFDGANWTQVLPPVRPSPRSKHAMVYHAPLGIVLFGGYDAQGNRDDTWVYNGTTWTQIGISSPPPARRSHAMAFDMARGITVLFGGGGGTYLGGTWEFNGANWTQITPPASPSPRNGHGMAYDPQLGTVLFGGRDLSGMRNDLWVYNGVTWTLLVPTTPPPARDSSPLVHVPGLGLLLYGGYLATGQGADTWLFGGTGWVHIPAPPAPEGGMTSMVFDPIRHCFVQFGGAKFSGTPTVFNATWELRRPWSWTRVAAVNPPSPRGGAGMVYDTRRARAVLFGGFTSATSPYTASSETWEYDGAAAIWSLRTPPNAPSARFTPAMAFDSRRGRTVLFGGQTAANALLGDLWEYDGINWSLQTIPGAPSPRTGVGITYDAGRGVVVLFGGIIGRGPSFPMSNETWEYDGVSWNGGPTANAPSVRMGSSFAYDPATGTCLLFGGLGPGFVELDETWEYDGAARTWTQLPIPHPMGRSVGAMAYDPDHGDTLMCWGRSNTGAPSSDDAWVFTPAAFARWMTFGFGCPGSNGTPPTLSNANGSLPQLGGVLQLALGNLPASAGPVGVALGFSISETGGLPLPLDLGSVGFSDCQLWTSMDYLDVLPQGGGAWSLSIPNVAALAGGRFAVQMIVVDPLAANGVGALTNAGIATIN